MSGKTAKKKAPLRFALVLAAGQGTRMKSRHAKVLHLLCGKPIIAHVLETLSQLNLKKIFVVVGHEADAVKQVLSDYDVEFVHQERRLGTGHAVITASPYLKNLSGSLLVLYGDAPLITRETLERLLTTREQEDADQALLTTEYENPCGYGRILRGGEGEIIDVIEEKEADTLQRTIREVNPGFYCFKLPSLLAALPELTRAKVSGEYYLTDLPRILRRQGGSVLTVSTDAPDETCGINTREELAAAESRLRAQIARRWMLDGVTIVDPSTVYIDASAVIGADTVIYPGVLIEGKTRIGSNCIIRSYSHLKNAVLEDEVLIDHGSVVRESTIGRTTTVGPFAHVRQNSVIGPNVRIGNFVEAKKTAMGRGSKAAHLTYLGDAEVGQDVNIGAGTITCNYDGVSKNKTIIEDSVFVGSNTQIIAPVTIHEGAYVAAGSTVTEDVPPHSLAIARSRQVNKEGWAKEKRLPATKREKKKTGGKASTKQSTTV